MTGRINPAPLPELGTLALLASLRALNPAQSLTATLLGTVLLLNHYFLTGGRGRPNPPLWTLTLPYTIYYALILAIPGQPGLLGVAVLAALYLTMAVGPAPGEMLPLAAPLAVSMAAALILSLGLGLEPAALYVAGPLLEHCWLRALRRGGGPWGGVLAPLLIALFYQWDARVAVYVFASALIRGLAGERLSARLTLGDHYARIVYGWLMGIGR